jgi:iron complex outermembrane recepter protein
LSNREKSRERRRPRRQRGRYRRHRAAALALAALVAPANSRAQTVLPDVNVIAPAPLSGAKTPRPRTATPAAVPARPARQAATRAPGGAAPAPAATAAPAAPAPIDPSVIARDKVPANTEVITSADVDHSKSTNLLDALVTSLPGVALSDQSGNAFQRNIDYRGFTASPVPGTPQSIAVYQNGVRINESYGDIVNWAFIPEMAINRLSLVPNNPVYGLNAIGGAMNIEMKNGFNYQGSELQATFGSYGREQGGAQTGIQSGNFAFYAAVDAVHDDGWRQYSSSSDLRRAYFDLGARNDVTEFHINFTGADNQLGAVAATPVQLLDQKWSTVYTWPQMTHLQLAFLTTSLSHNISDTLLVQGNAYYRGFWQSHVDGNGTDGQPCDPSGALAGQLCIGDGNTQINKNGPVANTISPNAFLGEIDRNQTATNSFGGSAQLTSTDKVFERDNHFVFGGSIDYGHSLFAGNSELGTIDPALAVTGTGIFINQPLDDISPVDVLATNTYVGIYATDTFDLTSRLSLTAGARFNTAQINLTDETGTNPLLNSNNFYERLNPMAGLTYKFLPNVTGYAGYSEANRAPTPLELGCSSPITPCMIDNFLIADPPLKQVVSRTYEAGLRGNVGASPKTGQLTWGVGVYRTDLTDDIVNIASTVPMFGYFQNAGDTRRQGFEAKLSYKMDRLNAYANYTYVDATYRSPLTISSPNNPDADANGNIFVVPGDRIPAIPLYRFKVGGEYDITDAWKFGADLNLIGPQYLIHDDSNQNPQVPAYVVVNLHTSYQVTKNIEVFGIVNNLFNNHYYSAGTFVSTAGFNSNTFGGNNFLVLNDPRTFLPGMPLAAYAGVRAKF